MDVEVLRTSIFSPFSAFPGYAIFECRFYGRKRKILVWGTLLAIRYGVLAIFSAVRAFRTRIIPPDRAR